MKKGMEYMTKNKQFKIEEEYLAPSSVRADWVSGFFKAYKKVLKSCNEEELEEIFNNVKFDWKMFNNGDVK